VTFLPSAQAKLLKIDVKQHTEYLIGLSATCFWPNSTTFRKNGVDASELTRNLSFGVRRFCSPGGSILVLENPKPRHRLLQQVPFHHLPMNQEFLHPCTPDPGQVLVGLIMIAVCKIHM
jgi:hypothetical protein